MADNYGQYSFCIDDVTEEEAAWLVDYRVDYGEEGEELYEVEGVVIQYELSHVYVYDDDGCPDTEALLDMLSAFMVKFRPQGILCFEGAYTCSKPRTGEFGGFAYAVYGNGDIEGHGTSNWLNERYIEHKEKGGE